MSSIYINIFSLAAALRVLAHRIGSRGAAEIVYLEKGFGAALGMKILAYFGVREFHHCSLGTADLTDAVGRNLFFLKDEGLNRIGERVISRVDWLAVTKAFGLGYNAENLRMDIRRRVNSELYVEFGRYLSLRRLIETSGKPGILVLQWSPFVRDIVAELRADNAIIVASFRRFYRSIREIGAALKQTWVRSKTAVKIPARSNTVAVQYSMGLDASQRNDLAWLQASRIEPSRILIFADGKAANRSAEIGRNAAEIGVRFVDMTSWQPPSSDQIYRGELAGMWWGFTRLVASARALPVRGRIWMLTALLSFARGHARWAGFFRAQNIKVYVNIGDQDALLVARTAAIEGQGGIDVSFQFSGMGWNLAMNSRPLNQHQFFTWGMANAEMVMRCDKHCPVKSPNVFFIGSHPLQYIEDRFREEIGRDVLETRRSGCSLVILGLDSACGRDVPPTSCFNTLFYDVLVNIVARHPHIGLVIKPHTADAMSELTVSVFQKLVSSGRAKKLDARFSPFQIFPHVDLVVGVGSGNSAVIESAMAEVPHIFFDNYHWTDHIFHERAPSGVVVTSEEALEAEILAYGTRTRTKSDPSYRAYLDWMDPFRDGKGHERLGHLIGFMAEEIDRHGDAMRAMPDIVARYVDRHGEKAVHVVRWPYAGKPPAALGSGAQASGRTI